MRKNSLVFIFGGAIFSIAFIITIIIFLFIDRRNEYLSFEQTENDVFSEYAINSEPDPRDDLAQVIDILHPDFPEGQTRFATLSSPDEYFTVNAKLVSVTGFQNIEDAPLDLSESDQRFTRIRFERPGYHGITVREESGREQFYSCFVSPVPSVHAGSPVSFFDWYQSQFNLEIGSSSNCGPSSAAMAVSYTTGEYFSLPAVRQIIGWQGDGATSFEQLLGVITGQGVAASIAQLRSVQNLIDVIDSGGIAIILYAIEGVSYGGPDTAHNLFGAYYVDHSGHYLVVKGYSADKEYFIVYDPIPSNWRTNDFRYQDGITEAGKNRYYSSAELIAALRRNEMIVVPGKTY